MMLSWRYSRRRCEKSFQFRFYEKSNFQGIQTKLKGRAYLCRSNSRGSKKLLCPPSRFKKWGDYSPNPLAPLAPTPMPLTCRSRLTRSCTVVFKVNQSQLSSTRYEDIACHTVICHFKWTHICSQTWVRDFRILRQNDSRCCMLPCVHVNHHKPTRHCVYS